MQQQGQHEIEAGAAEEHACDQEPAEHAAVAKEEGLWEAIAERWWPYEATLETNNLPLAEQAKPFVPTTDEERATARLLVWEGLGSPGEVPRDSKRDARMQQVVAHLRRRQAAGELDPDLDPACVAVVLFAEQLSDVLRHLRPRT